MASSDLTWTEAESPVNQIEEYRIYRSVSVLVEDPGFADSFVLYDTLPVVRDPEFPFGEVHPLAYTDSAVDFSTDTYCYRVDAVSVLVGEATGGSPQTGVGPSNIVCLGTQPSAVVLSGVCSGDDVVLDWTASVPALNAIAFYTVCRSQDGGAFEVIATVDAALLTYTDTTADCTNKNNSYIVKATDEAGIVSEDSNTLVFGETTDLFMMIANSGSNGFRIMRSSDGTTWELMQIVDQNWQELTYAPDLGGQQGGLWAAIAATAAIDAYTYLSEDGGASWRPATGDVVPGGWRAMDYSETLGLFCAISGDGATDGNKVKTSPDGDNWTLQTTPAGMDGKTWSALIWNDPLGLWIAGNAAADRIATSPDGITWTSRSTPSITVSGGFGVNNAGRTVSANAGDISNMWSTDGINWNASGPAPPNGLLSGTTDMHSSGGGFVASGPASIGFHTSGDGISWTDHMVSAPGDVGTYQSLVYHPGIGAWAACNNGNNGFSAARSLNGSTWGAVATPVATPAGTWFDIWKGARPTNPLRQTVVLVEDATVPNEAVVSSEGSTWAVNDTLSSDDYEKVAYSPTLGLFAAVGPNAVMTSPDGITWTERTPANASPWTSVIWSADLALFIKAASDSGTIMIGTSSDGITWTTRTTPASSSLHDVAAAPTGNNAIAVGRNTATSPTGNVLHSTNGISWAAPSGAHASGTVVACTYDSTRNRFVAIETGGECNVSTTGASGWSLDINSADLGIGWTGDLCAMTYSAALDMLIFVGNQGIYGSTDGGVSWTQRSSVDGGLAGNGRDVVYSDELGKFMACDDTGPVLQASTDGVTWYDEPDPANTAGVWTGIALGDVI